MTTKNEQTIGDIAKSATSAIRQLVLKDPEKIVGIGKSDEGWIVTVERQQELLDAFSRSQKEDAA